MHSALPKTGGSIIKRMLLLLFIDYAAHKHYTEIQTDINIEIQK